MYVLYMYVASALNKVNNLEDDVKETVHWVSRLHTENLLGHVKLFMLKTIKLAFRDNV